MFYLCPNSISSYLNKKNKIKHIGSTDFWIWLVKLYILIEIFYLWSLVVCIFGGLDYRNYNCYNTINNEILHNTVLKHRF